MLVDWGPLEWTQISLPTPAFDAEQNLANLAFRAGIVPKLLQELGVYSEDGQISPEIGSIAIQPNRPMLQRLVGSPALQQLLVDFYVRQLGIPAEAAAETIEKMAGRLSPLDSAVAGGYVPAAQQGR